MTVESISVVHECGTITSDTTWAGAPGQIYQVDCTVTVPAGVKLTIGPGTVVKSTGGGIDVDGGALVANGTAAAPITFTSIHDTAPGGVTDTSQDPKPGDWQGLSVSDALNDHSEPVGGGRLEVAHAQIAFAGAALQTTPGCGGCLGPPPPASESAVVANQLAVEHSHHGFDTSAPLQAITIADSTFAHDGVHGLPGNNNATGTSFLWAQSVSVTGSSFTDTAAPQALSIRSQDTPTVRDNTISGSGTEGSDCSSFCEATVEVHSPALNLSQLTGNTGNGNTEQSFAIAGTLASSGSLADLPAGWSRVITAGGIPNALVVPANVTLTVPAGTVVKFVGSHTGIDVDGGALVANGTAAAPITFTSIHDTAPGGVTDTSQDPKPGDWQGLSVSDALNDHSEPVGGGRLEVAHAQIAFAGAALQTTPGCGGCLGPPPPASESAVVANQLAVEHSHHGFDTSAPLQAITIADSTFAHDGVHGLPGNNNATGTSFLWAQSVSVTGSSFTDTAAPQALSIRSQDTPTVRDNTISGSGTEGSDCSSFCEATVEVHSPALNLSQLTGNTGNGNTEQSFAIAGTLASSGSLADLPAGWSRVITAGGIPNALVVPANVTLTVPAGTVVKFVGSHTGIDVDGGALVANGTAAAPITFTSIHDTAPGGVTDTSQDPKPGDWQGVRLEHPHGADSISYALFKYADTAIAVGTLSALSVHHTQFTHNQHAFTVEQTDEANVVIGNLPCVPPYTTFVNASDNWFGPTLIDSTGLPGLDIDVSGFIGASFPDPFGSLWDIESSVLSLYQIDPRANVGTDTIPVSIYDCTVPGSEPPIGVEFPIFPVMIVTPLAQPLWDVP